MKIGILSLVLHSNYGGILQSYALQTVLERMGHEVTVLTRDRDIHRSWIRLSLSYAKYLLKKYVLGNDVVFYNTWKLNKERREREQHTSDFINRYIHTRTIRHLTPGIFDDMDAIVVGSDQVWRSRYFKSQWGTTMGDAFLKFQEHSNQKRIAYAASFGTDEWEYTVEETAECARLLKKFDAVSVREASAVRLCKTRLGYNDARHVLDPTMLLDKEDYIRLVNQANTPKSPGNLMCYVLDYNAEKQQLIERIAQERALTPFYANSQINNAHLPNSERIQPPLEQWLCGFMDAEFVVTDSFHACVFSIIFGKPFVVVGNKERGMTRFQSLLKMFSLEQNLILSIEEYIHGCSYQIQNDTKLLYEQYRRQSFDFLKGALDSKK
jgi:hypothetical protein